MFERNSGYVSNEVQVKLANLNVLFAGCGVGSAPAEAMARLGLKNYILVDGDTVEEHNLNRQSFNFSDIGKPKVDSLKKRLLEINPTANISAINDLINPKNVDEIVKRSDIIFDTIDFLDLDAIVSLHDSAMKFEKPIVSLFTAGFGAVGIFIPAQKRDILR
jgi:tRNA A37 threonylcarbamoyladenosine dehydratase